MDLGVLLRYYKRKDIQDELIYNSKNREIAIKFGEKGFGKRPDSLQYHNDVLELARQGATSFHASEEIWKNPLQLNPDMKRTELQKLRIGWDLVLDIDCKLLEYSSVAADLVIKALKHHNITSISCKFSGNKGFHIAVPFEAFPEKVTGKEAKLLFPDGARAVAAYIKDMIKDHLAKGIMKIDKIENISKKTGKEFKDLVIDKKFNPFSILDIDTLLISSRHLFRMPYSFHEKTGLVSLPIDPNKVLDFKKEQAKPENVKVGFRFLDKEKVKESEAKKLLVEALDFVLKHEEGIKETREFEVPKTALQEIFFPPCIKKILQGLEDGRKRALFILINFLSSVGWDYKAIEARLREWNKNNTEPLREAYLVGQLRYHKQQRKKILPPNCKNPVYYKDIRVCFKDNLCEKIKNPVNYTLRKTNYRGDRKAKKKS